ncbi:glycosyltransferase family 39 protein [Chloroflexus sp.]|uniref:glycosyltransferase family 39 protein n=1 Tax=Chloroflexus sp. TaxID=1904827 RepID=UPI002628E88E|nr:glycosyltransferase family 39 protein [uncultured Chloroflexus sp.]
MTISEHSNIVEYPRATSTGQAARATMRALLLILALALLAGLMAYQAPPQGRVAIGWPGDRLFVGIDPGLGWAPVERGDLFADELTPDSPTGRSRWTRERAVIVLPNVGAGSPLQVTLLAQGWPAEIGIQPLVTVLVDETVVGEFTPVATWETYSFTVPAIAHQRSDLVITLRVSATLADSRDPRQKGVRLAEVRIDPVSDSAPLLLPAWPAVALLGWNALLLYILLARSSLSQTLVYGITAIGIGAAAIGLALARIWMAAILQVALIGLIALIVIAYRQPLITLIRLLVRRYSQGQALGYGLVTVALACFGYALMQVFNWVTASGFRLFWQTFPDSLLFALLGTALVALILTYGRAGLPRLSEALVDALASRRGAWLVLILFAVIWLGFEAMVVATLPYVGHADYSDNAIVARNLVRGRGWVVDYVSQFYYLYDGLTRPQETWPLLQPVWIAPFFALFGPTAWAAKLPNFIFDLILLALIYTVGRWWWDRRVGVTAAILVLTNYLFFRLSIYVTNDLGFVVFNMAAIATLLRSQTDPIRRWRWLLVSAVCTGLMMLQKPSGAMFALGMGLWQLTLLANDLRTTTDWSQRWQRLRVSLTPVVVWSAVALLILSPYLARNLILFGKPVYSTESYDAWVLDYRGVSGDAWAEIYRVFAPEWGGPGLPDRSWILRWGFDATLTKFTTQARELRAYLMPVWPGAPEPLAVLFSHDARKNILTPLGAWLALVGLVAAIAYRRRWLSLMVFAYAPYIVFMLTYWRTNEERYWVMIIPWLALLAAWMIWAGYDRLAAIGDRRWAPLGLMLALAAIVTIVAGSQADIEDKVRNEPQIWQQDLAAYEWLQANTPSDTVIMTRLPWQVNWHTERPAVMIPNTDDRALLLQIARYYGAKYLVLENQMRVKGDAGRLLAPLLDHSNQPGMVIDGFELLYASPTPDFRAFVYRIPDS